MLVVVVHQLCRKVSNAIMFATFWMGKKSHGTCLFPHQVGPLLGDATCLHQSQTSLSLSSSPNPFQSHPVKIMCFHLLFTRVVKHVPCGGCGPRRRSFHSTIVLASPSCPCRRLPSLPPGHLVVVVMQNENVTEVQMREA